jgi:hypothetical protein
MNTKESQEPMPIMYNGHAIVRYATGVRDVRGNSYLRNDAKNCFLNVNVPTINFQERRNVLK